jgi:hypothetical protein
MCARYVMMSHKFDRDMMTKALMILFILVRSGTYLTILLFPNAPMPILMMYSIIKLINYKNYFVSI